VETGSGTLPAGGHAVSSLQELSAVAPSFELPPGFASESGIGTLEVAASAPVSVTALRSTLNGRGEVLFTATQPADLSAVPATGPVVFPHFADGGGYTTALTLANTSDDDRSGIIEFFLSDGTPASLRLTSGESGSLFRYRMGARSAFSLETLGEGGANSGWILLTPDGVQPAPLASAMFRLGQNGNVVTEAAMSPSALTARARVWIDRATGRDTYVALANPAGSSVALRTQAFEPDGRTTASAAGQLVLPARGHAAALSADLVEALPPDFRGLVEIQAAAPVAALSLRSLINERGEVLLTTLPVADLTRPAPWPVFFPHIADGGGFTTELILLSPPSAARVSAEFRGDSGQPWPVAVTPAQP
jgi:hypothetical protein